MEDLLRESSMPCNLRTDIKHFRVIMFPKVRPAMGTETQLNRASDQQ